MYCFIPSWYSTKRTWQMYDRQFYRAADFSEFDDTVSQIRMFLDEKEDVSLLPLCYAPNLRRFLHRQGIHGVKVTSVFDEIQGIAGDETAVITYQDLPWPADVEWSYTPYVAAAYQGDRHIANVEFDEDGSLLWVNYYTEVNGRQQMSKRYVFDDRGFISSILYFEGGEATHRDYYDREGIWQIREDCANGSVEVNTVAAGRFSKVHYQDLPELITEKFAELVSRTDPSDVLVVAAKEQHDALVLANRQGRKAILSFYGERYDLQHAQALRQEAAQVGAMVADTEETADTLRRILQDDGDAGRTDNAEPQRHSAARVPRVYDISPFDTRLSLGRSQQMRKLKVFFPIDGLQEPIRTRAILEILDILQANSAVELLVVTRSSEADAVTDLAAYLQGLVDGLSGRKLVIAGETQTSAENAGFDENGAASGGKQKERPRIYIRNCMQESDITRELQDTRLIVDVRDNPDQYIQVAGISTGIPQVNYRNTRYVAHLKNGYMIHNIADLGKAMLYYLDGLQHWNEALVYCIRQISEYTGGRIVERWREMVQGQQYGREQ